MSNDDEYEPGVLDASTQEERRIAREVASRLEEYTGYQCPRCGHREARVSIDYTNWESGRGLRYVCLECGARHLVMEHRDRPLRGRTQP